MAIPLDPSKGQGPLKTSGRGSRRSYSFCGRGLRVLTLSDPGRFSARPRPSLRESVSTHSVRTLPSSTCLVGRVPSARSCHPTGKTH